MLQLTGLGGLGAVPQEFIDCIAADGDPDVCRALHPSTDDAAQMAEISAAIEMPEATAATGAFSLPSLFTDWFASGPSPGPTKAKAGLPIKTLAIIGAVGLAGLLFFMHSRAAKPA